ncbi:class I SAM-dependent methyltransferase [Sphingomonas sp. MMS24-J13]|uniref:class I SAM-dependent methyltransferase n=1 Tax=Sphingomonas sp. MMS24-J13 TaxID=3238686 RepID=UPI00384E4E77
MLPPDLTVEIAALIAAEGPISIERFMGLANAHYYATRDPLGAGGDFVTAPEISQMFGEMIGLALADLWDRAGRPDAAYVELGPGRGTLAVDALRAMAVAGLRPTVHLVETSPVLRALQEDRLPQARWHDTIASLPIDRPLLIVANEFFDALPVRQFVMTQDGWCERMMDRVDHGFVARPAMMTRNDIPAHLRDAEPGTIVEQSPAGRTIAQALAQRLVTQGGALIIVDYGHKAGAHGDTLQAVHAHAYADPFVDPGARDLTAHVDFAALGAAGAAGGARVTGPVAQGQWLITLGLSDRAAALARRAPERAEEIAAAYRRLTGADEMGELFKCMALVAPHWPNPAGF